MRGLLYILFPNFPHLLPLSFHLHVQACHVPATLVVVEGIGWSSFYLGESSSGVDEQQSQDLSVLFCYTMANLYNGIMGAYRRLRSVVAWGFLTDMWLYQAFRHGCKLGTSVCPLGVAVCPLGVCYVFLTLAFEFDYIRFTWISKSAF